MTKKSDKMLDDLLNEEPEFVPQHEKENLILEPLLEEIEQIRDENIQSFVRSVLLKADLFWEIPSVFSEDYNPPDEHDIGGNVLHTKRMFRVAQIMCESYIFEEEERDIILSAVLLHAVTKGIMFDSTPTYNEFFPYTVDPFVRQVKRMDELNTAEHESSVLYATDNQVQKILRIVRCHRGPWSPIPETIPLDDMEMVVHLADHVASKVHWIIDGDDIMTGRWRVPG